MCGIREYTTSVPTVEAVDFGDKYTQQKGQIRGSAGPTRPTAGPETYREVLEDFLDGQRLAVAHWGDTDTES